MTARTEDFDFAYGAKSSFMADLDTAPSTFAQPMLYSPLEPLFGGEFSLSSPELAWGSYNEFEDTPPLSADLESTRTSPSSPLLASPLEQPDLPLFMLPSDMKMPLLQPQADAGLAPIEQTFALDDSSGRKKSKKRPVDDVIEGETEEEARRRKARDAQRKCRARKAAHVENLEFQIAALSDEQERLSARAAALRAAIAKQKMAHV